jgi:hypothetical protein
MNGSTENTAYDASEKPSGSDRLINLGTARRMLPLVRRIVEDVLRSQRRLATLQPEQARLDREKRTLAWPARARRYQLREEIAILEQERLQALIELGGLGVALLDLDEGRVGFPTLVNNRHAYFSWRPGEETLNHWHFDGECNRRPIPAAWAKAADINLLKKG